MGKLILKMEVYQYDTEQEADKEISLLTEEWKINKYRKEVQNPGETIEWIVEYKKYINSYSLLEPSFMRVLWKE
jgi:hypothetical protein